MKDSRDDDISRNSNGTMDRRKSTVPAPVNPLNLRQIDTSGTGGFNERVALQGNKPQKTVAYLWGANHFGQLGLPVDEIKQVKAPVEASYDINVKQIACGEEHTALLSDTGEIWSLGNNSLG